MRGLRALGIHPFKCNLHWFDGWRDNASSLADERVWRAQNAFFTLHICKNTNKNWWNFVFRRFDDLVPEIWICTGPLVAKGDGTYDWLCALLTRMLLVVPILGVDGRQCYSTVCIQGLSILNFSVWGLISFGVSLLSGYEKFHFSTRCNFSCINVAQNSNSLRTSLCKGGRDSSLRLEWQRFGNSNYTMAKFQWFSPPRISW